MTVQTFQPSATPSIEYNIPKPPTAQNRANEIMRPNLVSIFVSVFFMLVTVTVARRELLSGPTPGSGDCGRLIPENHMDVSGSTGNSYPICFTAHTTNGADIFYSQSETGFRDMTDGQSNTLALWPT